MTAILVAGWRFLFLFVVAVCLSGVTAAPHPRSPKIKKSLFRDRATSGDSTESELTFSFKAKTNVKAAAVGQSEQFCSRFSTSCSSLCSTSKRKVTTNTCSRGATLFTGNTLFSFRCGCNFLDQTLDALIAASRATNTQAVVTTKTLSQTQTLRTTSTQFLTSTQTLLQADTSRSSQSTITLTALVATTSTLPVSTLLTTQRTTLDPSTVIVTSTRSLPTPLATLQTTLTLPTPTVTVQTTVTEPPVTTTIAVALTSTDTVTSTVTSLAAFNAQALSLKAAKLQAANGFCSLYLQSCATTCVGRRGVSSQACQASSANSYSLRCTCGDGTVQLQHALNAVQAPASTVTSTVTTVKTVQVKVVQTATALAQTTRKATVVKQAIGAAVVTASSFSTVTVQPSTTILKTAVVTVAPGTTLTSVRTLTLTPSTTSYTTKFNTVTPGTVTKILATTTTPVVTRVITSTVGTTVTKFVTQWTTPSSTATASSSASPQATDSSISSLDSVKVKTGHILVTNAVNSKSMGVLSTTPHEDAVAFTLTDAGSSAAMAVSPVNSTTTGSTIALQILSDGNFALGLEAETMNDQGIQPASDEILLLTNTVLPSVSSYPSYAASSSGAFLAESRVWALDTVTGSLTAVWTNPQGTRTATVNMLPYVLCTDTMLASCFVTAAASNSTWSNFDTTGVTITPVKLSVSWT